MLLIQIILLAFIAFAIITIVIRFKEKGLSIFQTIAWLLFWLAAAVVVIDPTITVAIANTLGITRGSDLVIYLALMILFYAFYRIQIKMEKIERQITKIVQDKALKNK